MDFLTQDWLAVLADLPQILQAGFATGFQYALIAFGFVLIYRATEIVNFAQGDMMMVSMFIALALQNIVVGRLGLGPTDALPWGGLIAVVVVTVALVAALGAFLDLAIFRRMAGQSPLATVIITIALGFILRLGTDVVTYFMWGAFPNEETLRALDLGGDPAKGGVVELSWITYNPYSLVVIGAGLALLLGLFLFLSKTRTGIAIQAASQNQLAAVYQGINVRRLGTLVWAMAAGISAFAGILFALNPKETFTSSIGLSPTAGIMAYAAAVIGGLGSLRGAVIAALLLGIASNLIKRLEGVPDLISSNAGIVFLLLVIVFRPAGLFPQTAAKKV